jgi:hypothetical protein
MVEEDIHVKGVVVVVVVVDERVRVQSASGRRRAK